MRATATPAPWSLSDASTWQPVSALNAPSRRAAAGNGSPISIRTVMPSISPRSTAPAISARRRSASSTVKPDCTKWLNVFPSKCASWSVRIFARKTIAPLLSRTDRRASRRCSNRSRVMFAS